MTELPENVIAVFMSGGWKILNNGEHNPSAGERLRGMKKREVTANAVTSPDSGSDVSG